MKTAKTKHKQKMNFQLKGINLLEVSVKHPQKKLQEKITFHFNINIEHRINPDSRQIFVLTTVNVSDANEKGTLLGNVRTSCNFEIQNFNDFYDAEKKRAFLPEAIQHVLNSIAISTTRGVMFSQFRGTFLHNAYLPVIDPKSFRPELK